MIASPPPEPAHPTASESIPSSIRATSLLASFRYAFAGLRYLLWTQRNAKIHSVIAVLAIGLGLLLGFERYEWLILAVVIALVLCAEGMNTAIEATVNLASPEYHPFAKIAKDVGAGTVLLTAIVSVIIGMLLFLPHLWALLVRWLG